MAQVGNIPEIQNVKKRLEALKQKKLIEEWELPYENILTRLSAAIFFITPTNENNVVEIWNELENIPGFNYCKNEEKKLSDLAYRITFLI